MVPQRIIVLSKLPLSANGKVDRKALAALLPEAAQMQATPTAGSDRHVSPFGDDIQLAVARIWSEVLGTTDFDADASFFDVGGNSMLLLKLFNRLAAAFPERFTVADLFSRHTIRGFAALIHQRRNRRGTDPLAALVDRVAEGSMKTGNAVEQIKVTLEKGQ
jgi:hypothetical protein